MQGQKERGQPWPLRTGEERRERQRKLQAAYRSNPEKAARMRDQTKKWYAENKAVCVARSSHNVSLRRIAKARKIDPSLPAQPELTCEQKQACIDIRLKAAALTKLFGDKHVVDHIIEIADGGHEVPENLQILTWEEHNRKSLAHRVAVRAAYRKARGG